MSRNFNKSMVSLADLIDYYEVTMRRFVILMATVLVVNCMPVFAQVNDLIDAIQSSDLETVKSLVEQGVDVNAVDADWWTALMLASYLGQTKTAELLIANGADVNAVGEYGYTALMWASEEGQTETAELLIANGADVNAVGEYGYTALMWASEEGQTETAELLIANGADVNAVGEYGYTALMWASEEGQTETAELLIANGADVNAVDNYGGTALMRASEEGQTETAELLIANGAWEKTLDEDTFIVCDFSPHETEPDSFNLSTPLSAVALGVLSDADYWLEREDPNLCDAIPGKELTPLYMLAEFNKRDLFEKFYNNGASLWVVSSVNRHSVLSHAASFGSLEVMDFIIETEPRLINKKDLHGNYSIHHAAHGASYEAVLKLAEAGEVLTRIGNNYSSPLNSVAFMKWYPWESDTDKKFDDQVKLLKYFFEKGNPLERGGVYDMTPFLMAAYRYNISAMETLKKLRANMEAETSDGLNALELVIDRPVQIKFYDTPEVFEDGSGRERELRYLEYIDINEKRRFKAAKYLIENTVLNSPGIIKKALDRAEDKWDSMPEAAIPEFEKLIDYLRSRL